MNRELLRRHIDQFITDSHKNAVKFEKDFRERKDLIQYYQQFSKDRIMAMTPDDVYEYLSKLWAMLIWGNKHYVVDKIIEDNSLKGFVITWPL